MEFPSSSLQITPIKDPSIPQQFDFDDCFSITFNCTKKLIQIIESSNPAPEVHSSSTTTTAMEAILVPSDILCSGTTPLTDLSREDTILLHKIFFSLSVSPELFDQILPNIVETARRCDSNTGEIVVNLHVTSYNVVQYSDEQDDDAECTICLEKFDHGNEDSSVDIVRTNCSHVFHNRCLLPWLRCCANCESPHSCPLCRSVLFPTSEIDDE
ncbi:E3 ubiquitin-protein ligase RHA2B-like [Arachis stenosperma]|uniref:E3 ubiquitin-protein ligase RHA2B-like n=1 Tax=Arachis stenosperma TaxID=217475 RepID=UPI0025AB72E5|nr:E3 ubiquitin-protein ligase RHA2B-like [Arachis stenosperma]